MYRFFDAATWMIPPALPIFFGVCQSISLQRLSKQLIFAVDPAKTVIASDVEVMCFDKTGTLTKNAMEVVGYSDYNNNDISKVLLKPDNMKQEILIKSFASCHGVYLVENEYLGDELDIRMLEFSEY